MTLKEKVKLDSGTGPGKLKLNLGCGTDWRVRGVINIDCRNLMPPDGVMFLRADVRDLGDMFADGCADELWAHDVLEHFPQAEAGAVLGECGRLLCPGGVLHLRTPDLTALARHILDSQDIDEAKAYRVYGGQDYAENFHRAGFTGPLLRSLLEARKMRVVESSVSGTNLAITARKEK